MTKKTTKTELEIPMQYRMGTIEAARADGAEGDRQVELSFSSDEPVERFFGVEILGHKSREVDLSFFKKGAGPLLLDHDTRQQIGKVERVWIEDAKRAKAIVRFGKSALAEEIFNDVNDGIRSNVSVGYRITSSQLISSENDVDTHRMQWKPLEISLVAIPADSSVGVGRSGNPEKFIVPIERAETMPDPIIEEPKPAAAPAIVKRDADPEALKKSQDVARSSERQRINEIRTIAVKHDVEIKLVDEAINDGATPDEFARSVLDSKALAAPHVYSDPEKRASIGLTEKEKKQFSFLRAMRALHFPNDKKIQEAAGFERECSFAVADQLEKESRGFMVPCDVLGIDDLRMDGQRDLTVGVAADGGNTVATDLLAANFIELLRNRLAFTGVGAQMLAGLRGNVDIPKHTGGAAATWITAEDGAATESQATFGQLALTPKDLGAFTEVTRRLLMQSSLDMESLVRRDLITALGLAVDLATGYGSAAAGQPRGIVNTVGIAKVIQAGAFPTYAEVVAMETAVAAANADIGSLAYATEPTVRGALKTTEKATGTAQFIWEPGNTVNGYQTVVSKQITTEDIIFGNFADVIVGLWGGLDLLLDPYTNSTTGKLRIVAIQTVDVGIRHAESFCLGNNTP